MDALFVRGRWRWGWIYALMCGALIAADSTYLAHHLPLSLADDDLWQHLAAIQALIDNPLYPSNPFLISEQPSRLFGPLWVGVALLCRAFYLNAQAGFVIGAALGMASLAAGAWLLGTARANSPAGGFALLGAMLGGWLVPPCFTGYHNILTLLVSGGYPAIVAVGASLMLWGLSLRYLGDLRRSPSLGAAIVTIVVLGFATHPLGMAVGLAGAMLMAFSQPDVDRAGRFGLALLIGVGLLITAGWPWFNPLRVAASAISPEWEVGTNFYSPWWIAVTLFPAVVGLFGLLDRASRPLLALLMLCLAGYALASSGRFIAGHRLLPWCALVLHVGLASLVLRCVRSTSRPAMVGQALVLGVLVLQALFVAQQLDQRDDAFHRDGDLLVAARALTAHRAGRFAGYRNAAFPIAALGIRPLVTSFAEPLVPDMRERQRRSDRLFDPRLSRSARLAAARREGVRYLVIDRRFGTPYLRQRLEGQAAAVHPSGSLERIDLY